MYKIFAALLALLLLIITVFGAAALSVDGDDKFVVEKGGVVEASFLIIGSSGSGSVTTQSSIITLQGRKSLSYSELSTFEDARIVEYKVQVKDDARIGRYEETIIVNDSGESIEMHVVVDVQNKVVVALSKRGSEDSHAGTIILIALAIVVLVAMIVLWKQLRRV